MALMSGSIPMVAIQINALRVHEHVVLDFVQVLDLTELRSDDTQEDDSGGGRVERSYWDAKAGPTLMKVCEDVLAMVNQHASGPQEFNYLRGYIGLRSNGVVRNPVAMSPKPTRNVVTVWAYVDDAEAWMPRVEEAGVPAQKKRSNRIQFKLTPEDAREHAGLIREAVAAAVERAGRRDRFLTACAIWLVCEEPQRPPGLPPPMHRDVPTPARSCGSD